MNNSKRTAVVEALLSWEATEEQLLSREERAALEAAEEAERVAAEAAYAAWLADRRLAA
jgi:hypothetical protein